MKLLKEDINNSVKKRFIKRSIALFLATLTPLSLASCKNKEDDVYSNEITTGTITYIDDDNEKELTTENYIEEFLKENEEPVQAIEDIDYDSLIEEIMKINYNSDYSVFNDYDIYNAYSREKEKLEINNLYNVNDNQDFSNKTYDWYKDGIVDTDILYNKIIKNNLKNGLLFNTSEEKLLAKTLSQTVQANIDYMKINYPDYNLDSALYVIDNLTVESKEGEWRCFSAYNYLRIYVNPKKVSNDELLYSLSHELFHMILCKSFYNNDVTQSGASIDYIESEDSPLKLRIFSEDFVESASHDAHQHEDPHDYWDKDLLLDFLCYTTGKNIEYFRKAFVYNDIDSFINCFEPQMRDPNLVFSIYAAMDLVCGEGYIPITEKNENEYDTNLIKGEANNYLRIHLLKNLHLKLINEMKNGNLTKEEAKEKLSEGIEKAITISYKIYWADTNFENFTEHLSLLEKIFLLDKTKIL